MIKSALFSVFLIIQPYFNFHNRKMVSKQGQWHLASTTLQIKKAELGLIKPTYFQLNPITFGNLTVKYYVTA